MTRTQRTAAPKDFHIKFRASEHLQEQLEAAAKANNRTVSEEIRQRLEPTFGTDPLAAVDPTTRRLLAAIGRIADGVRDAYGAWNEDPLAFQAMRETTAQLFAYLQSAGGRGISGAVCLSEPEMAPHSPNAGSVLARMLEHRALGPEHAPRELAMMAAEKEDFGW